MNRSTRAALLLAFAAPVVAAAQEKAVAPAIQIAQWQPLFRGVEFARGAWATPAGPQAAVAVRIDLLDPAIRFYATPDNGDAPLETAGETAVQFAKAHQVQIAVNTAFFSPCCSYFGTEPKDLASYFVSQGVQISSWTEDRPAVLAIDRKNHARIFRHNPKGQGDWWFAGSGMDLLKAGKPVTAPNDNRHPRTVAGLSADGRSLIFAVIDGRQPKHSIGASLNEAARWLIAFGGHEGINFDGGGSSILVAKKPNGGYGILNQVSSGLPRVNGAHVGVFAEMLE